MNTNEKGDITEAKVLAALLSAGRVVLHPYGHKRYDLAWEEAGRLIRVQCKTGRLREGAVQFSTVSKTQYSGDRDYLNDAEFFGVFCPETDKVYIVPVSLVPLGTAYLRVVEAKNKQSKKILWARDFELQPKYPPLQSK